MKLQTVNKGDLVKQQLESGSSGPKHIHQCLMANFQNKMKNRSP